MMTQKRTASQSFTSLRLSLGLPAAAIVTAALFLMMGDLIKGPDVVLLTEAQDAPEISVLRKVREETKPRPAEIIDVKKLPNPPVTPRPSSRPTNDRPNRLDPDVYDPDLTQERGTLIPTKLLFAEIKTGFSYPNRCAVRGIEGEVVVEFDVAPDGSVINPRIISSTDSCFDRATLSGIRGWKYKPSSDGRLRRNVRERIVFNLEDI